MFIKYTNLPHSIKSAVMLWLVIVLFLTSCAASPTIPAGDGQILNLFRGTADWIINGCMHGECGTQIWVKDNLVIYARPLLDGFAFTGDASSTTGVIQKMEGGNFVNWSTWADFRAWMQQNGWSVATMKLIGSVADKLSSTLTILVLPVGSTMPVFPYATECDTVDGICNWEIQP